jgi:catechol 2,3-dioxygenase-like lactoylglutathione lyase family enzyme
LELVFDLGATAKWALGTSPRVTKKEGYAMINGAHVILYSKDAEADRAFLKDVLGFGHVDAGHGWLIFALPPSEIAVHPDEASESHELYLMTDDVEKEIARLATAGVACEEVSDQRWGRLTYIGLPSGGRLGLYEPRHARP